MAKTTLEQLQRRASQMQAEFVDLCYTDLLGRLRHVTLPADRLPYELLEDGLALEDGSRLIPDDDAVFVDPFGVYPALGVLCDVRGGLCVRTAAKRAAQHLRSAGVADQALVAARIEFFIFDQAHYDVATNRSAHYVESAEGAWRRGDPSADNLAVQPRRAHAHLASPPADALVNLRAEMVMVLREMGVAADRHERGPAAGPHGAIELAQAPLVRAADQLVLAKFAIRNAAARHGKVATFMAQPLVNDAGSNLRLGLRLTRGGEDLFGNEGDAATFRQAVADGIHQRTALLSAFLNPSINSYRRLARCKNAAPVASGERLTLTQADSLAHPYLALAAIASCAVAGAADSQPAREDATAGTPAHDLAAALDALAAERDFLARDGVFDAELVSAWIEHKQCSEVIPARETPQPLDFELGFDL